MATRMAQKINGAWIGRNEAEPALARQPGNDLDAVVGFEATEAGQLFVGGGDGAVGLGVEVRRRRALDDSDDLDLVVREVRMLARVAGCDRPDDLDLAHLILLAGARFLLRHEHIRALPGGNIKAFQEEIVRKNKAVDVA